MADTIILKVNLQNEEQVIAGLQNIDKLADKLRNKPITIKIDTSALDTMRQIISLFQKAADAAEKFTTQQNKAADAAAKQKQEQDKSNKSMKDGAKSAGLLGDNLARIIAKIAAWQTLNGAVATVKRSFTEALETMKAVDTELTTIQKVTDMSDAALKKLGDTAYSTASKYGVAADEYLQNIATFSKAGYQDLAQGLGELAIKTQLVGDVNAETASKFLLSTDAAYKYNGSVEALSAVLDKANAVENNYATSIEKIAEGMPIVASVAEMANISVEETIAALGTITAKTQESGTSAARAFRALILNIIGDTETEIEDGVTWSADEIESLNDVLWTYSRSAMEAAQATGEIVNPMVAIAGLSQAMEDGLLTEAKLAEIASSLGGKLRTNQLVALIEGWDTVIAMLGTMENAAGSADKEVETMLGSWEKKSQVLKNTWTETVASYLDTDAIKGAIDGLTTVVDALDSGFGKVAVSMVGFASGGMLVASAVKGIAGSIIKATAAAGGLTAALLHSPLFWGAAAGLAIYAIVKAVDALTVSYEEAAEATEALKSSYEEQFGSGSEYDQLINKAGELTAIEERRLEILKQQRAEREREIQAAADAEYEAWQKDYGTGKRNWGAGGITQDKADLYEFRNALREVNDARAELEMGLPEYQEAIGSLVAEYGDLVTQLEAYKEEGRDLSQEQLTLIDSFNALTEASINSGDELTGYIFAAASYYLAMGMSMEEAVAAASAAVDSFDASAKDIPENVETTVDVDTDAANADLDNISNKLDAIDGRTAQAYVDIVNNLPDTHFASGTKSAPGGPALVNEKGPELISAKGIAYIAGGGRPTITNLPKGATVLTAEETRKAVGGLKSINPIRAYEEGTGNSSAAIEAAKAALRGYINGFTNKTVWSPTSQKSTATADGKYIYCARCGRPVLATTKICPYCGADPRTGEIPENTSPSGGGGKGTYSAAPDFKALEDELDSVLSNLEAQAELADNQGQHSKEGDLYGQAREKIQELLDKYRAAGYSETSDEVLELQNMLYDYAEQQEEAYRHTWDELEDGLDAALDNINAQIEKAENENDIERQVALYGQAQEKIGELLNQYLEAGFDPNSDEVLRLANLGYDYAGKQTKLTESLLDDLIDALNGLKDTTDRAKSLEEKQLAVEEAQKAYDAVQNQRTVRIFNPVTGQWEWVAKASDVLSAQKNLESAQDTLREEQFSQAVDRLKRGELKLEDLLLDEAVSSQFSAASDAEKQNFLSALGAYSGGVNYGASTAYNNTTNSQTDSHDIVYNFNGFTIGKTEAEGMTLAQLAAELRFLKLT